MEKYKTIALDQKTYDEIKRMAKFNQMTIRDQVAWMVGAVKNGTQYRVISISDIPHPADAISVPLILVQES